MTKIAVEKILRMQYKYGALMYQAPSDWSPLEALNKHSHH
jgi:hypothetical protein